MLKEIFLIENGLPIFHYSSDQSLLEDSDKVLLSSGFLAALKNFSETERSEEVDSFSTGNERFIFMRYKESDKMVVGVFDKEITQNSARKALKKIHNTISDTGIFDNVSTIELGAQETKPLRDQISLLISQLFGEEGEDERINEILSKRTDIPLAFLISSNKKLVAKFARPKPLFRDQQVKEYFLLFSTIQSTLSRLQLPKTFVFFTLSSKEYAITSVCSGLYSSVATGSPNTPVEDVLNVALEMVHHSSLQSLIGDLNKKTSINRSLLTKKGDLIKKEGSIISPSMGIFLSTLYTRLNAFFRLLTHRNFDNFVLVTAADEDFKRELSLKRVNEDFILEISEIK